jgi:hypothetical protein
LLPADVSLLLLEAVAESAQVSSILDRLDYLPSYIGSAKSKKKQYSKEKVWNKIQG